jgi:hypothetical protein
MKLARPDIFHPRIVLAGRGDDAGITAALRHRGLHARRLSWDDPQTRDADLVILRDARDCAERLDEFLAWTTGVANLLNPPDAVAWNLGERYLRDLEGAGVPTLQGKPTGRTALIFLGGAASHAFTGAGPSEPEFEVWDIGYAAIAAAAEQAGIAQTELLYARADVSGGRLARLDLVAPSLGWRRLDAATRELAQRRFAMAVESACERLGLGPFSHRGP